MITHEKWQGVSYRDFLAVHLRRNGKGRLPNASKGVIVPFINHGRWLVECPTCSATIIISESDLVYICPECGSPENQGQFYTIKFPADKDAIEQTLDKRLLKNQNWETETVAELIAENQRRGL